MAKFMQAVLTRSTEADIEIDLDDEDEDEDKELQEGPSNVSSGSTAAAVASSREPAAASCSSVSAPVGKATGQRQAVGCDVEVVIDESPEREAEGTSDLPTTKSQPSRALAVIKQEAIGEDLPWKVSFRRQTPKEEEEARRQRKRLLKLEEAEANAAKSDETRDRLLRKMQKLRRTRAGSATPAPLQREAGGSGEAEMSEEAKQKAINLLIAALRSTDGDTKASEIATAVVDSFSKAKGADARRCLLALVAALRSNTPLRAQILESGVPGVPQLTSQNPEEWVSDSLQEKKRQWKQEFLAQAKSADGQAAECPACGGRAVVQCGRSGTGRAARLSKLFAHYKCREPHCGKDTHIKEG